MRQVLRIEIDTAHEMISGNQTPAVVDILNAIANQYWTHGVQLTAHPFLYQQDETTAENPIAMVFLDERGEGQKWEPAFPGGKTDSDRFRKALELIASTNLTGCGVDDQVVEHVVLAREVLKGTKNYGDIADRMATITLHKYSHIMEHGAAYSRTVARYVERARGTKTPRA